MIRTLLVAALALACVLVTTAEARPKHHIPDVGKMVGCSQPDMTPCSPEIGFSLSQEKRQNLSDCSDLVMRPCGGRLKIELSSQRIGKTRRFVQLRENPVIKGAIIGTRPPGCPRAYCGCGASLYLFGRIIPSLNLAANWLRKFPRALPAPGMVAARRGHVFVLVRHISGHVWLAHDSNSGRGKTRLHPRSIAGFQIIDPHGVRQFALSN